MVGSIRIRRMLTKKTDCDMLSSTQECYDSNYSSETRYTDAASGEFTTDSGESSITGFYTSYDKSGYI